MSESATSRIVAPFVVIARSTGPFGPDESGQLADQHRQMGTNGRFTAGEANALDPVALDEDAGEALDLFERHHLFTRQATSCLLRACSRYSESCNDR